MFKTVLRWFSFASNRDTGTRKVFHASQICSECGSKLWAEAGAGEKVWSCPNPDCPAQIRARIVHWCSSAAMDVAGGERLAAELIESGLVQDVAELYRLKSGHLTRLEGLDQKSAVDFLAAIA